MIPAEFDFGDTVRHAISGRTGNIESTVYEVFPFGLHVNVRVVDERSHCRWAVKYLVPFIYNPLKDGYS